MFLNKAIYSFLFLGLISGAAQLRADVITFESYTGSSVFGNPTETLSVPTSIGNVTVAGGVVLTGETNLPADETSVYGTAYFGGSYSNTITLTFPSDINNFFVNIYNGQTYDETFTVADNLGHSNTVTLAPNLSSGTSLVSFPAVGDVVTITTSDPYWDFSVDNLGFNQATPGTAPEPASIGMFGLSGIGALAMLYRRRARS